MTMTRVPDKVRGRERDESRKGKILTANVFPLFYFGSGGDGSKRIYSSSSSFEMCFASRKKCSIN